MPQGAAAGHRSLAETLARLTHCGLIPRAGALLEQHRDDVERALREAVLAEIPAFSASANPEVLPGLARHGHDHVMEIMRLFGGGGIGDFDFVRVHARQRADQHFPLDATLHAYRCGHRVFSRWLREVTAPLMAAASEQPVAAIADFSIEYTNAVSIVAAADYVAQTRLLAEAEGDRRMELLNVLLSGFDESDGRVAQLLKRGGYLEQRQAYCVAVLQSVNPAEMESTERAQRIVAAITAAAAASPCRVLAGVRNHLATAIFSERRRQSGWTSPQSNLAAKLKPLLEMLGLSVVAGVSGDHPSTAYLPRALSEAMMALDFASVTARVQLFTELPLRRLLVHHGASHIRATPPAWTEQLATLDSTLIATLRALAAADLNVQRAARDLGKHPNTIHARLARIEAITGRDGQRYDDLSELLLAADCLRL